MAASDHLNDAQFFHVTTKGALASIREHGIDNTRSMAGPWDNVDDWEDGAYLWDSHERAATYAQTLREHGHEPAIVKVKRAGLEVRPDDTGAHPVEGAWYARRVPPSHIEE